MDEEILVTDATEHTAEVAPQVQPEVVEHTEEITPDVVEPAPEVQPETVSEEETATPEEPEAATETIETIQFEGLDVNLSIPAEANEMLTAKGFNAKDLASEFFEDGKLSFSEATRSNLDAAFGKVFVDMMIQGQLQVLNGAKSNYETQVQAAFDNVSEICGGDEGWETMANFATTLPDEDIDNFNAAMESGNAYLQRLAVQDMVNKMGVQSSGAPEPTLDLILGSSTNGGGRTSCSPQEYHQAIVDGSYYENPSQWDTWRRNHR